jgi:HD-like signal output (HDOD) protein
MNGQNRRDPGYGKGTHEIDEVLVDALDLAARLRATFEAPDYKPPLLPPVALQLLALSQRPNAAVGEMADLLEKDPLLAARVLKLVRSPLYLSESPIRSIKQAIVRLGLGTMRDLVMEAAFGARILKVPGYSEALEKLRRHSIAVAHLSRVVGRYTPMEAEFAFLCGLLHDVGFACSLLALADSRGGPRPDLAFAWPVVDGMHEEASGLIARLWNLPPEVQHVVSHHHQIVLQGYVHPLCAVVCLGDHLADELGFQVSDEEAGLRLDVSGEATLARARAELRLGDPQLELIGKDAKAVVAQLKFAQ